jgi:hypothetical protein
MMKTKSKALNPFIDGILATGDLFGNCADNSSRDPGLSGYFAAAGNNFVAAYSDFAWAYQQEQESRGRAEAVS